MANGLNMLASLRPEFVADSETVTTCDVIV